MKKQTYAALLAAGFLVGMLAGPSAVSAAENWLKAVPSTNTVYVDGRKVDLDAWVINGHNYVQLRDVAKLVDFNVYWDGAVQVDTTAPYTGEAPVQATPEPTPTPTPTPKADEPYIIHTDHWSREDFSRKANPAVFTGPYTRELYNTIRQSIVDAGTDRNTGSGTAYCMVSKADYGDVKFMVGRMTWAFQYQHYVPENFKNYYEYLDYYAVNPVMLEQFKDAWNYIQPVIREAEKLKTDRAKVEYLNNYLCSLLEYDRSASLGLQAIFSPHTEELKASCGHYAHAFQFLCEAAGILCIRFLNSNHSWNLVYVEGKWLHVDVSTNDNCGANWILLNETAHAGNPDRNPAATAFLKELLVPGSTK